MINKKIPLVLICAALPIATCYADSLDTVEYDRISKRVRIEGNYDKTDIFSPMIVLKIENADKEIVLMTQNDDIEKSGTFLFDVPVSGASGEYTVIVNSNAFEKELSGVFDYFSESDIQRAIDEINSANSYEEFGEKLNSNAKIFGLDTELLQRISDKNSVYSAMYKKYAGVEELFDSYIKSTLYRLIYENADSSYSADMLEKYKIRSGIDKMLTYPTYEKMSESERKLLVSKISGLKSENDFEKSFNEAAVLVKVRTANSYGEVRTLLTEYKDICYRSDISKYFDSSDTSSIDVALVGNDYKTIDELCDAIKKLSDNGNNGDSGKGNHGSTGGSSGGGISAPAAKPETGNSENKIIYTDIDTVEWAKDAISALSEKGILNGKGEGLFKPNDMITREEFVKVMIAAFEIEVKDGAEVKFSDVLPGAWYEKYINAGVSTGCINGLGNGEFGVGKSITREDMAVMAYRFTKYAGYSLNNSASLDSFEDRAAISEYAKEAVSALLAESVVNGMNNSKFEPKAFATRAQAAVMLYRLLNCVQGGQI